MFERYKEDIQCFMEHDPAARSPIEIVLLYPGFKALRSHRKAQWFLNHKMPFIARYISQRTAHKTGIEIHPGAKIGRRVCIDHGNGIVIGETTEVGDDVMIYQGVTLGGTGKDKGKQGKVLGTVPSEAKVVVEGINMVTCHIKPRKQGEEGGIVKREAAIYASKVQVVCPKCDKGTRVAYEIKDGKKVRVCKHCGAAL